MLVYPSNIREKRMKKGMAKTKEKKGRYFEKLNESKEPAQEKILKGARRVFAAHPFTTATTRMIAEEAGVEHSLIHYYFGTKENLFELLCEKLFEEFSLAMGSWFDLIEEVPVGERFSHFLDLLLAYANNNPEPFKIVAINMVQAGSTAMPGSEYITKNLEYSQKLIEDKITNWQNQPLFGTFISTVSMLVFSFLGARETIAKVNSIDPATKDYDEFVKNTLLTLYQPLFEKLRQGEG
jgi:AcrR family transcriptional regulator